MMRLCVASLAATAVVIPVAWGDTAVDAMPGALGAAWLGFGAVPETATTPAVSKGWFGGRPGDQPNDTVAMSQVVKKSKSPASAAAPTVTPPVPLGQYSVLLKDIILSHGELSPPINPKIFRYTVVLDQPLDQVAMVPEVDRSRPEYQGDEKNVPIVTMTWAGNTNADPESSSLAMKKQIDLPDDGKDLTVSIKVQSPIDGAYAVYKITFKQQYPPPAVIKVIEGFDDTGDAVLVQPSTNQEDAVYHVYANPEANKISLQLGCNSKASMKVNGKSTSNGSTVTIKRDKARHTQLVEVICSKSINYPGIPGERKYAVLITSDFPVDQIHPPRLVVDDVGAECVFDEEKEVYRCPDPKTDSHKTRLISSNEPSIKYVLTSSNRQVEVRVLNKQPTIPFTYSNHLTLTAYAGQFSKSWPVYFSGTALPSVLQIFGWLLALLLAVLLFALLCVLGCSNIFGLGVPLGATEIAATLTLIIQYLCFANFMRGSSVLTDMVAPLKWVTLFWPLPWTVGDSLKRRQLMAVNNFSSAYGLELWGDSSLGDVTDIRNACGCMFWSCVAFAAFLILHSFVYLKFAVFEREYTFPHRAKYGNWESRVLHWLAFPASVGCAMVLASDITTVLWKVLAGCLLAFYVIWIIIVYFTVQSAVDDRRVCWIWNSSVREDGQLEDESGYWMDIQPDQLLTQPVNRSLCKGFFPYRWISTVADIVPVSISGALFNTGEKEIYPPQKYARAHREAGYPLAKNPQIVEVVKTRAPGGPCKGQRLISGLLRTQWLDVLFTFQGLTRFHSQIASDIGTFAVPLIAKTSQLSGPIAAGRNAFFYDGVRIPFIRIGDFLYRLALGTLIGVALASEGYKVDAAMFGCAALLSGLFMVYVAGTKPYSRKLENWLVVIMLATICFSAFSFMYYAVRKQDPSAIADVFLWLVAACCLLLALYSCVVTFSLFSALFCPPLEESRFLEKLANCNVTISDEQGGWTFDVPAFSKFPVRDLKAHCAMTGSSGGHPRVHVTIYSSGEEPSLEFSAHELRSACRSGYLSPPVCTVFVPANETALGYRHFSVAHKDEVHRKVAEFLAADEETRAVGDEVGRHIAHQVEVKGRGKTILSVTVIPPRDCARWSGSVHGDNMTGSATGSRRSTEMSRRSRQSHH